MKNDTLTVESISQEKDHGFLKKLKGTVFYIKLTNWEYWPLYIANFPLLLIWLWFALRARKLFFFSAVNPVIETGGMWGESKYNILQRIPEEYLPKTIFIHKEQDFFSVKNKFMSSGLSYPVIAKPDIGERGTLVVKIKDEQSLFDYFNKNKIDFLIQELISYPVELSVMHHRMPGNGAGRVTSVCVKETLKVTGDGISTVAQLMAKKSRAKLQLKRFEKTFPELLEMVPASQQILEVEPIGNHCRGTMFLNGNHYIDKKMTAVFNSLAATMDNIYYGRFDLKCSSVEDLKEGRGFKILEYNGIGAEPAHIYDPSYPLFEKYRDIYRHWKIIYRIYRLQKKKGVKAMSVKEAIRSLKAYFDYQKLLKV